MKWFFPAKTFLVGEYVALQGGPAIVLTTAPCFEVTLTHTPSLEGIHPQSPAGKWWIKQNIHTHGLSWYDPYQGLGGLGASGAQFLGAYAASQSLLAKKPEEPSVLLSDYLSVAWQGDGVAPSGYDVVAQSLGGCTLIHQRQSLYATTPWPFSDLAFILLRTGVKIPTHDHLNELDLQDGLEDLTTTATIACEAWQKGGSAQLIAAVRLYHEQLKARHWVADGTLQQIAKLQDLLNPLAIKGCGAMGADIILLLLPMKKLPNYLAFLSSTAWIVLASNQDLSCLTKKSFPHLSLK